MPWLQFDEAGKICGICSAEQVDGPYRQEERADDDPTVVAFLNQPTPVPNSCTKLGLKRAFAEQGTWSTVKAAIAADADALEEWNLAIEIKRTDALVEHMIAAIGLTEGQVDSLLIRANALV
jgi:hypothetical protein